MKSFKLKRTLTLVVSLLCILGCLLPTLASCKKDPVGPGEQTVGPDSTVRPSNKDSIVLMTEELSGLFNPFYATTGTDMEVVGLTQIGMLGTDRNGNPVAGDDEAVVVKAFEINPEGTVYTFVIKNGLKFSDGYPLTMNDVLFNMYEYLDPVYTGSSTMYSIKIEGLTQYRTQANYSGGGTAQEDSISAQANAYAKLRIQELISVFETYGEMNTGTSGAYSMTDAQMIEAINTVAFISDGYKNAVATPKEQETMTLDDYRKLLMEDYELTKKTFREELVNDYKASKDSFDITTAPYNEHAALLENEIFKFFLYEGYITPVYELVQGKKNLQKIVRFDAADIANRYTDMDSAVNRVYKDTLETGLNNVLRYWGTAGTLTTQYSGAARDVILHSQISEDGTLAYPNISGIVSLGHTTEISEVTVGGTTYKVAHAHNPDGTPVNADEYDVLRVTLEGADPKAIYNFGFTVAPHHYYSAGADGKPTVVDIANNKFGVEYASSDFQTKVIQSSLHVEVPVGAGAFVATDANNNDNPTGANFWKDNVVYYKANTNFMDSHSNPNSTFRVRAPKLRLQVVSSTNALDKLASGEIDYITPQFTKANSDRLKEMEAQGFKQLSSWQLGYGYIGINAGLVPNINIRKAIMSAMQTSLALEYYQPGTCKNIDWPMSNVSWAYPTEADGVTSKPNGRDFTSWTGVDAAKNKITKYMNLAGVTAGDSQLTIKFTIAGASITEHPTYAVFKQAAELLNECGWNVEVKADAQALTKLSTGSLAVWAAAWGSTIDPDMYQVYHKNSTATSVYSWGYREILANPSGYEAETKIINQLSGLIDDGRETLNREERKDIYENAMGLVLDMAVELPVYQRMVLYAYNSNNIKGLTESVNPYSSPLEKIWELELVNPAA